MALAGLYVLWLVVLAYKIQSYGHERAPSKVDVAIVLGAGVDDRGPTPVFRARLDHAAWLYRHGYATTVIVTGGRGPDEPMAEGDAGAGYLRAHGVPAERVLAETRSTITEENLRGARALMRRHRLGTAAIVSDPLHMYRAMTVAADERLDAVPAPTPTTLIRSKAKKIQFLAREAVFSSLYLGRRAVRTTIRSVLRPVSIGPIGVVPP